MNFPGKALGLLPDLTRNCLDLWAIVLSDTTSGEALEQNPTAAPAERTNREAGERGLRLSLPLRPSLLSPDVNLANPALNMRDPSESPQQRF